MAIDDAAAKKAKNGGGSAAGDGAPQAELTEEEQMQALLGFGSFTTTKDAEVPDNHTSAARGAVKKNQNRLYRQYMNRRGGFNRPLDKVA